MEKDTKTDYTEQINDLRTQMEWFYNGQTLLGVEDIDKECTRLGLDFNDEMKQANDRAKFKTELDEYEKLSEDEKNARWDEMTDKAGSLGLILEDELSLAHERNQLREDMSQFHQGTSEMSIQEIDNKCKELGLNFNYEMESAKDIKANNYNTNKIKVSKNDEELSNLIDEIINDKENCYYYLHRTRNRLEWIL